MSISGDDIPDGNVLGMLLGFGVVAIVVVVGHRKRGSMNDEERQRAEQNQRRSRALARYYLWAAAVGAVGLVVVGILALLNE